MQSLVLLLIAIIFFDACNQILGLGEMEGVSVYALVEFLIDLSCGARVMFYIILMFREKIASADETARILDTLDRVPCSDPSVTVNPRLTPS